MYKLTKLNKIEGKHFARFFNLLSLYIYIQLNNSIERSINQYYCEYKNYLN